MPTIGTVWDRMHILVAAQGYALSRDAFDFDIQPDSKLDTVYFIKSARMSTAGFLGGDQDEQHLFEIYLAARTKRQSTGAARQLKVDMDLIEAAVLGDDTNATYDYFVTDDGVSSLCQAPATDADYVIGRLSMTVQFAHEM